MFTGECEKALSIGDMHIQSTEKNKIIYSKSLFELERRVKSMNLSWTVKDEDIYEDNITKELEEMDDVCILDVYRRQNT